MDHDFVQIICLHCGTSFNVPVYCGDRFCSICSVGRRMRIRQRLEFLVNNVKPAPGMNFKHLTLTVKNQNDLSLMTTAIMKSFRKLRQTASWKSHVSGGAFVVEITGDSSGWHVHLHIIIEAKYYKWATLLALWMRLSAGRGVYIQNIPKRQVVRYLTKYLSKNDVPEDDQLELNDALKGVRLFQPFGSWFAINLAYVKPPQHCNGCSNPCFIVYWDDDSIIKATSPTID